MEEASMERFVRTFGTTKPIIAMAHLPPLPGSPLYDADGGVDHLVEVVVHDIEALQSGGVDAIMFGNEGDRPYVTRATPESLAAMSVVITRALSAVEVPYGVNYLWDPVASIAIAHATGAQFVREVFTGVYDSDMGLWIPNAAEAVRLRRNLGADTLLLYNINAEFASSVGTRTNSAKARSAVFASLADGICVSGPMTGDSVAMSDLEDVKSAIPDVPVIANTGVRLENVADILSVADAAVVGTSFKRDGNTWNPVDRERVKAFMDVVRRAR